MAKIWHRMYVNWFDNHYAGNRVRAALWGFAADAVVRYV